MLAVIRGFWRDQSGATAIEYGLIALGIALVIVVAVQQSGINLRDGVYADIQGIVL